MVRRATEITPGRVALLISTVATVLLGSAALAHFALGEYADLGAAL